MLERDIWIDNDYIVKIYDIKPEPHWTEKFNDIMNTINLQDFTIREQLEQKLEEYTQSRVLMTNSGTSSLMLSMMVNEWEDAEIIGPNFGNPAWVNACNFINYKPVFVDIKKDTLCIDPNKIGTKINSKTKAIVFVNHGGYNGEDISVVREICRKHGLVFIEDSCNSMGWAGDSGDVSMFSFSSPKVISAGEGGCIITKYDKYYEKLKKLIYQGGWYDDENRTIKSKGANFNLSPVLCHYIYLQLKDVCKIIKKKKHLKERYRENGIESVTNVDITYVSDKCDRIYKSLSLFKIQSIYKNYQPISSGDFPISKWASENTIQLPFSYQLDDRQIKMVSTVVRRVK